MIVDQFDKFRTEFSDCVAVVFLDIASGTVLCVSTETKTPQERLDALCAVGAELLDGDTAQSFCKVLDGSDNGTMQEGVFTSPSEICLFLRSDQDPMEALAFVCDAKVVIDDLVKNARKLLNQISAMQ